MKEIETDAEYKVAEQRLMSFAIRPNATGRGRAAVLRLHDRMFTHFACKLNLLKAMGYGITVAIVSPRTKWVTECRKLQKEYYDLNMKCRFNSPMTEDEEDRLTKLSWIFQSDFGDGK